jgi:hypothetical protein
MERIALPDFLRMPVTLPRRKGGAAESGALVTRVTIDAQPAGAGTLAIGLRPLGKPAVRANPTLAGRNGWIWSELPTDAAGVARLEPVTPGRYLTRRYWRPAGGPAQARWSGGMPDPLAWRNAVAQVEVTPKQQVSLPPLALDSSPRR